MNYLDNQWMSEKWLYIPHAEKDSDIFTIAWWVTPKTKGYASKSSKNVTLSAKSSLILPWNKAAFPREGHKC